MKVPPIPEGWTRDLEWFNERFRSDRADARNAALERLWFERRHLDDWMAECISALVGAKDGDPEPFAQSLGSEAKVDLLSAILQSASPSPDNASQFQKDLAQTKGALEACDQIVFRSLLDPEMVWLLQVGAVIEEVALSAWQLRQSFRRGFEYKPRASAGLNSPN